MIGSDKINLEFIDEIDMDIVPNKLLITPATRKDGRLNQKQLHFSEIFSGVNHAWERKRSLGFIEPIGRGNKFGGETRRLL